MKKKLGFTLVEIMIVVAIIAILAAVAIPNFIRYRKQSQATACVSNLSQIDHAKQLWYMHSPTDPQLTDLVGPEKELKNLPTCAAGGTYTVGNQTTEPTCSIGVTLGTDFKHAISANTAASTGT